MVILRKKIKYISIFSIFVLSLVTVFTVGEDAMPEMQEVSATNKKIVYEIYTDEEGYVILAEKYNDKALVIKREKATSPMRKRDIEVLGNGIVSENLEEALMIFEDFVS